MWILHPVVEPPPHLAAIQLAELAHRSWIGFQAVGDDRFGLFTALQRLLHGRQSRRFVAFLRDRGLQNFAFMFNGPPQIDHLAVHLHVHLVKVSAPRSKTTHVVYTPPSDIPGEHRAEMVPSQPHSFMTDIDAALKQQTLHVAQAQRKADLHHHDQADDFWRRVEIAERTVGFAGSGHSSALAVRGRFVSQ